MGSLVSLAAPPAPDPPTHTTPTHRSAARARVPHPVEAPTTPAHWCMAHAHASRLADPLPKLTASTPAVGPNSHTTLYTWQSGPRAEHSSRLSTTQPRARRRGGPPLVTRRPSRHMVSPHPPRALAHPHTDRAAQPGLWRGRSGSLAAQPVPHPPHGQGCPA